MASWKKIITSGSNVELNNISASGDIIPITTDGSSLGSINHNFSDLFLDSGAVINFDGDDVTLTHSSNKLTIGGGSLDVDGGIAIDNITIDGTEIDLSSGDLTIDVAGDVIIDADGGDFDVKDNGVGLLNVSSTQVSGSALSTGSFGTLHLEGTNFSSASLASAIAGTGDFEDFTVTADGGSDQTITNGNTLDIAGGTNITTAVGSTDTVTINLDNEIINSSLKAGRDSENLIDFASTDNKIIFRVNNINQVSLLDNVLGPEADSDVDLGTTAKRFKDAFVDSVTVTDNVTVGGNLTVNGTTTTIASTNTEVKDQFLLLASGSSETNLDAGIIVQSGSVAGTGSAFYHDISEERWAVGKEVDVGRQAATTHTQFVTTVKTSTSTPSATDGDYGVGEMWVDTDDSEPTGNGVVYIRTA